MGLQPFHSGRSAKTSNVHSAEQMTGGLTARESRGHCVNRDTPVEETGVVG